MSLTKNDRQAFSSEITFVTFVVALFATCVVPPFFTQEPASLTFFISFLCGLLITFYFLITIIRRKKISLAFTPLTWPLIILAIVLIISNFVHGGLHPETVFLGIPGLLINFCFLSIFASTLIKKNNGLIVVKLIIFLASLSSLTAIAQLLNHFFTFIPNSFDFLFSASPLLHLSIILIGFAAVFSRFFKKNRLQLIQLIFIPLFCLGLIAALTFNFQIDSQVVTLNQSTNALNMGWQNNDSQTLSNLLLGFPHQSYSDFFYNFQSGANYDWQSTYLQAFNLPLTLLSLSGIIALLAWLFLFIKTIILAFSTREHNYLFFILLVSFIVQLFTPIYPLVLLIQALIIAFTANKNKEVSLNLNVATVHTQVDGKKEIQKKEQNSFIFYLIFLIIFVPFIVVCVKLNQSYIGYYYAKKALDENVGLQQFYDYSLKAQKSAPFVDSFNRLAAIASLEMLVNDINNDPEQKNLELQRDLAQQGLEFINRAVTISPKHTLNLTTRGAFYQEIGQYNADRTQTNSQAASSYASAILTQPSNPNLYLQLASLYQFNDELDLALSLCQQALKIQPDYLPTIYQLAQIYQLQGNLSLAQSTYQQAQQLLDPESANYQTNYELIEQNLQQINPQ
ncbi:MAG: hypothetical protein Q4G02_02925 [bacterium]|nr:hypothetical protein [bacterium]